MKKEDVRSEGERPTVYRRRFLGTECPVCPRPSLYLLPPSRCPSWCPGTGPDHMSRSVFGLHRLRGPPDVVIRSTCHFLFLGSRYVRSSGLVLPTLSFFPHSNTHSPLADFICLPSIAVHATRSMFPVLRLFPFPCPILARCPCFECFRHAIDPERPQVCSLSTTHVPLELLCPPGPLSFR
jgi:hypothetical protein